MDHPCVYCHLAKIPRMCWSRRSASGVGSLQETPASRVAGDASRSNGGEKKNRGQYPPTGASRPTTASPATRRCHVASSICVGYAAVIARAAARFDPLCRCVAPSDWKSASVPPNSQSRCSGRRKAYGASQGRYCRRDANDGARATGKAQPPPMLPSMLAWSMFFVLIKRK
jgi:hypothetical protein